MRTRLVAAVTPLVLLLLWPAGVVFLWLQPYWRRRDKLIGALVLPGGLFLAWFIATGVRTSCRSADGAPIATGDPGCAAPLAYQITHPTASWGFNHVFGPVILMTLVALPIIAAIYLEVRLWRRDLNP